MGFGSMSRTLPYTVRNQEAQGNNIRKAFNTVSILFGKMNGARTRI